MVNRQSIPNTELALKCLSMAIHILSMKPGVPREIYEGVPAIQSEFPGDWKLSILNSTDNDDIELKLSAPSGVRRTMPPQQHSVGSMCRALCSLREECVSRTA